ncbi:lipase [Wolbachia endosymbiont of Laodelphax striatellus]|uniref:lipase family protein n=1 Tax=Wolbachia endosymbiont of Laodelphax striatellus TaxID=368602 RepID=UPI0007C5839C|nr:lipase family protein [Wolbachia endosymbiont of Laodelphax striatellus]OAB82213.1 lipase [Wolbachia endosymbiont of Laodelphax striatellus]
MDFSFLRNWFSITGAATGSEPGNTEQPDSISVDDGKYEMKEYDDEFEIIEDYEFINRADPNEPCSLPFDYKIDESIVKIAGFDREKLLEMGNFCKISYGDDDGKLSKKRCNNLAQRVYKTEFEIVEDFEIVPSTEKMYKTRAELISEGYEIIPFGNSFEKDAGHVFIKGKEITIAYHGTRLSHSVNDGITDINAVFTTSELLPNGGRMHRGFYNSFADSWPNLYGILKSHAEKQGLEVKDFKVNLTGHSMEGAIAKIAALCLNKTEGTEDIHVATFGDPRVFDLTASEFYNDVLQEKTIRVTQHRQDPVPAVLPGICGYAHVGAQLRISVPEGYFVHQIDGYHEAIKIMDEKDFRSNNNVSLFYYPSRILSRINCAVLGNAQYYAANLGDYILGGQNFFEKVKKEYQDKNLENFSKLEQAEVKQRAHQNVFSTTRSL